MESLGVFRRLQLELFGMDIVLTLVAIIVLVVLSAFFSGSETALTAAQDGLKKAEEAAAAAVHSNPLTLRTWLMNP